MSNYYLGVDVSKGYSDFAMIDESKNPVEKGFQLDDTFEGHLRLAKYLEGFISMHPDARVYAAVESTGGYENNWYERMRGLSGSLPLSITRLNPKMVKANSEAELRRTTTDAISARDIASFLISHPEKVRYNEPFYPMLRRQWSLIELNKRQVTQLRNHLDSVLYGSMPEMLPFCRHGVPQWLLKLLKQYPSYGKIEEAGYQNLMKIAYVSKTKAIRVTALAKNGIGKSDEVSGQIISTLAEQILRMDKDIKSQKKILEQNYKSYGECIEDIEILKSFKGIGVYSAVGLMLNITSVRSFDDAKKLSSYFGVHPKWKQSGDGTWGNHMSKEGRSEPRAILFMVTMSAIRYNPVIRRTYSRCLARNMNKMAAVGVCMHKVLRIVYGMLKHKKAFDPKIDEANTQRTRVAASKPKTDARRRLHDFDPSAPISRRQHKKREEQTAKSHDEHLVKNGIKEPAPHQNLDH